MAIITRSRRGIRREIDIDGPDGNAYALMGVAQDFGRQLKWEQTKIKDMIDDMKSSDYEHLLEVFNWHFGQFVNLVRTEHEEEEVD